MSFSHSPLTLMMRNLGWLVSTSAKLLVHGRLRGDEKKERRQSPPVSSNHINHTFLGGDLAVGFTHPVRRILTISPPGFGCGPMSLMRRRVMTWLMLLMSVHCPASNSLGRLSMKQSVPRWCPLGDMSGVPA